MKKNLGEDTLRTTIQPRSVEDDHAASATEEEDWEEDNRRSERLFGYDPVRDDDVWDEYQAAMGDPMFA